MNTAEINEALTKALNSQEYSPDTILMGTGTYIELVVAVMDFGWWPMSVFRRQGARKALLLKRPSLIIVDAATVTEWAYSLGVVPMAHCSEGQIMGVPFIVRPGESMFAYPVQLEETE